MTNIELCFCCSLKRTTKINMAHTEMISYLAQIIQNKISNTEILWSVIIVLSHRRLIARIYDLRVTVCDSTTKQIRSL